MAIKDKELQKILGAVETGKGYSMTELLELFRGSFSRPTLRKYLLEMEGDGLVRVVRIGRGGPHYYSFRANQ
ncbi:MAG: hypothetical protein KKD44_26975 [Proteobacteria bacterium]|nr:hypothetical protein [Pseudomonadota bacterium]